MSHKFSCTEKLTLAASVTTGLENVAASEVREKLGYTKESGKLWTGQGRVHFETTKEALPYVHKLKSIDRLFLIVETYENYIYKDTKEDVYADLKHIAGTLPWSEAVKVWDYNAQFCKPKSRQKNLSKELGLKTNSASPADDLHNKDSKVNITVNSPPSENKERLDDNKVSIANEASNVPTVTSRGEHIRFRVSTNRVGKKQPLTSPEASYMFGGEIQDVTQWKVDLSNFNLEVLLCLGESSLQVAIALTNQSLHRRNITHFGVTTLRATTAYCMLKMCKLEPGDIVFDPMCGSGAIPVECALEWPDSFHIAGDNAHGAVTRCISNLEFINDNPDFVDRKSVGLSNKKKTFKLPADVLQWDVTNLPIKRDFVDVIVTDLPFGKRIGSKADNRKLYPATLRELARISKCGTGRACLLTQDKRTMKRTLDSMLNLWKSTKTLYINIGGLTAGIFLLKRTRNHYEENDAQ